MQAGATAASRGTDSAEYRAAVRNDATIFEEANEHEAVIALHGWLRRRRWMSWRRWSPIELLLERTAMDGGAR